METATEVAVWTREEREEYEKVQLRQEALRQAIEYCRAHYENDVIATAARFYQFLSGEKDA